MSNRLLKVKIDGFCVPQYQLGCTHDTTNNLHKHLVKFCCDMHYMCGGDNS